MKVTEAITQANQLRLNVLNDDIKASWLNQLDCELAEMMGVDPPENKFPEEQELLLPREKEHIYTLYLVAKIDYFNSEFDLYNNDMTICNGELTKLRSWYIQHNRPQSAGNWRV